MNVKIFVDTKELGFHTKSYIFENKEEYKIIIGSSNITQRALKSNVEWNVLVISKNDNKLNFSDYEIIHPNDMQKRGRLFIFYYKIYAQ